MICAQAVQRNICIPNWANACQSMQVTLIESKPTCANGDLRIFSEPELQALITQATTSTTEPLPQFDSVAITKVFSAGFAIVVLFFWLGVE